MSPSSSLGAREWILHSPSVELHSTKRQYLQVSKVSVLAQTALVMGEHASVQADRLLDEQTSLIAFIPLVLFRTRSRPLLFRKQHQDGKRHNKRCGSKTLARIHVGSGFNISLNEEESYTERPKSATRK